MGRVEDDDSFPLTLCPSGRCGLRFFQFRFPDLGKNRRTPGAATIAGGLGKEGQAWCAWKG